MKAIIVSGPSAVPKPDKVEPRLYFYLREQYGHVTLAVRTEDGFDAGILGFVYDGSSVAKNKIVRYAQSASVLAKLQELGFEVELDRNGNGRVVASFN